MLGGLWVEKEVLTAVLNKYWFPFLLMPIGSIIFVLGTRCCVHNPQTGQAMCRLDNYCPICRADGRQSIILLLLSLWNPFRFLWAMCLRCSTACTAQWRLVPGCLGVVWLISWMCVLVWTTPGLRWCLRCDELKAPAWRHELCLAHSRSCCHGR